MPSVDIIGKQLLNLNKAIRPSTICFSNTVECQSYLFSQNDNKYFRSMLYSKFVSMYEDNNKTIILNMNGSCEIIPSVSR
jgi:hypothetical protein